MEEFQLFILKWYKKDEEMKSLRLAINMICTLLSDIVIKMAEAISCLVNYLSKTVL